MHISRTTSLLASALLTVSFSVALARAEAVATASASTTAAITPDAIEEDWQLVIGTPDVLGIGPQITTCMSPVSDNSSPFVALDMNYREYPSFAAGGLQVQVWDGSNVLSTATHGTSQFSTAGETITWTQAMSLSGGNLSYSISNGQSTTWGKFGQGAQLSVSFSTTLPDLSGYDPDTSAAASGASWEQNFVTSLQLVQVRYYANGQLIWTDDTPRTVVDNSTSN
jgi:hypothetical protein